MGWLAEINADLREAVAHLRRVHDDALYKSTVLLYCSVLDDCTDTLLRVACTQSYHAPLVQSHAFSVGHYYI